MPHIESIPVAAHALEEGAEERDDLLKEWMVTVTFRVCDLCLEYFIKGVLDLRGLLFRHSAVSTCVHCKHCINQDGFKDELVRLDRLSVMYHICQLLQHLVATFSSCFMKARREQCIQDSHTVDAILSKMCLCNLYILVA